MANDQLPDERRTHGPRRRLALNIRSKIVLPYLILTLIVAIIGTYVVTSLVASSLDERLTNHLLEAGRVVSDSIARNELAHLESARFVAYTRGVVEALVEGDSASLAEIAPPVAAGLGTECLIVVDAEANELLHVLRRPDGTYQSMEGTIVPSELWMVETILVEGDPAASPRRGIGLHPGDDRYYYFTAIPVPQEEVIAGVIIVGSSLDSLLAVFKSTSLADVTIYSEGGEAVASSFVLAEPQAEVVAEREALLHELAVELVEHPGDRVRLFPLREDGGGLRGHRAERGRVELRSGPAWNDLTGLRVHPARTGVGGLGRDGGRGHERRERRARERERNRRMAHFVQGRVLPPPR